MIRSPAGYDGEVRIKRYLDYYQSGYGAATLSERLYGFSTPAGALLGSEPTGLAVDFTSTPPSTLVRTTTSPVTNYYSGLPFQNEGNGPFTFSRTLNATVTDSDGKIKWAGHNLVLNSAAPVTQNVTTVVGGIYKVEITGSGSVTLSGAGTGTASVGSPATITATTTTLTLTVSGTVTTMWAYRSDLGGMVVNPANASTYYPTTSTVYYGPRIDFDGATLASKGFLVEEARTNLFQYSAQFDNAYWLTLNATVTNSTAVTAPDGTQTADALTSTNSSSCIVYKTVGSAAVHTVSVYAKAASASSGQLYLYFSYSPAPFAQFNLQTGLPVSSGGFNYLSSSITPVGGGWYRCSLTATLIGATLTGIMQTGQAGAGETIYIWGGQMEAGGFPSSYIPTIASTAQRTADVADVSTTAFPYSSTEGTLVANFTPSNVTAARRALQMDDGTENERVTVGTDSTPNGLLTVVDGGLPAQASIATGTPVASTNMKLASRFKVNDFALSANGAAPGTDTSGTLPTMNTLRLGSGTSSAEPLNGWVRQVTYLPRALTDAELVARST